EAQRAGRRVGAVGDGDVDLERALVGGERAVGDATVGREVDLVSLGGNDVRKVDVVAVRVDPVGKDVVGDRSAGLDGDRRAQVLLRGRGVLVSAAHADLDAGAVRAAAAIIDRVSERRRGAFGFL